MTRRGRPCFSRVRVPVANDERHSVLLTGFGPFPGVAVNASGVLASRLAEAARARFPGYRFTAASLPTEWEAAPRLLAALLDETRPVLSLHFGVSRTAQGFVIETQARNEARPALDACGARPLAVCVIENGAERLPSTLPAEGILARLAAAGLPTRLSQDAGGYLCNAVFYHALCRGRARPEMTGFVHIPVSLSEESRDPRPALDAPASLLSWGQAIAGGLAIVESCLVGLAPTAGKR